MSSKTKTKTETKKFNKNEIKTKTKKIFKTRINTAHDLARRNLQKAQLQNKFYYDRSSKESTFKKGDKVCVHNKERKKGLSPKLQKQWRGLFIILEKLSPVNLSTANQNLSEQESVQKPQMDNHKSNEEPGNTEIYENQNSLRGEETNKILIPSTNEKKDSAETEEDNIFEVDRIRNHRTRRRRREFLIKCKDYDETNNNWEPENNLSPKQIMVKEWERICFLQKEISKLQLG